jgi:hypothetical protein
MPLSITEQVREHNPRRFTCQGGPESASLSLALASTSEFQSMIVGFATACGRSTYGPFVRFVVRPRDVASANVLRSS